MNVVDNVRSRGPALRGCGAAGTEARDPLLPFFLERYAESYMRELDAFVAAVLDKKPVAVSAEDGRRALVLADAALEAVKSGRAVRV